MVNPDKRDAAADEVQPEFREDAGSGDLGAERTGPPGLGPESGSGSAHDYPGGAAAGEGDDGGDGGGDEEGPISDSPKPAGEQDEPEPERPPEQPSPRTPDKPEGER